MEITKEERQLFITLINHYQSDCAKWSIDDVDLTEVKRKLNGENN